MNLDKMVYYHYLYINLSLDISGFKKLSTMSEFLLRLHFWVRSFGCKDWRWLRFDFDLMITKVFLAWNLFCSNFWAKYRFDKSIARSTYGKNTKWQNFYMSTIFAYLRNLFSPFITWKFGNFFEFTFCSQKILQRITNYFFFPLF